MRWWPAVLLSLVVGQGFAQTAGPHLEVVSSFVVGTWYRVYWLSREGQWASAINCDDGHRGQTRVSGFTLTRDGKLVSNSGQWGCVISGFQEQPMRGLGLIERGPRWAFSATCDEAGSEQADAGAFVGSRPLRGPVNGAMEMSYPREGVEEPHPMLDLWIAHSPRPGQSGLLSLFLSDRYGPYVRCGDN